MLLDVLRGFAIFGMFMVNMTADLDWGESYRVLGVESVDRATIIFVDLLLNGRFITIFSVLFGIGFFVQLERAKAKGVAFVTIYLRRILGLMLIACLGVILGMRTGILIDYAFFGVLLLLFRNQSPRTLLFILVLCFFIAKTPTLMDTYAGPSASEVTTEQIELTERNIILYGSFPEVVALSTSKLVDYLTSFRQRLSDFDILGLLLLGLYVGRCGFVYNSETRVLFARRVLPWLAGVGTVGVLTFIYLEHFLSSAWDELPLSSIKWLFGWNLGMIPLGLAYAAGITLLMNQSRWERYLLPLASVGRLALSNYIFTNLVYAVLSYGWGFGLYGQMRPATGLLIVLLLMPVQISFSQWWIQRFRFGPFEWCWRTMTYGRLQKIRLG